MQEHWPNLNGRSPHQKGLYFKQYIAGIGDGIAVLFAFCIALSVWYKESNAVLNIGLIAAALISIILGVGSYFAAKSRQKDLLKKTPEEEKMLQDNEFKKTVELFKRLDLGTDMQQMAADVITKDDNEWKAYLTQQQQTAEYPEKHQLLKSTLATVMASITGGLLGLLPWALTSLTNVAVPLAWYGCLPLLFMAGFFKSKVNREPIWWGGIRQLLLGASLALAGYFIAEIFQLT